MLSTPYRAREPIPVVLHYEEQIGERFAAGLPRDDEVLDRAQRNEILNALIFSIDAEYGRYESSLYLSSAALGTVADLATLGATGAATALSSGGNLVATAILTGAASAITGGRLAIQEQFFAQHGRIALIATMRALRADAMTTLVAKMRLALDRYPLSRGLLDVQRYAQAGSVVVALQAIVDSAVSGESRAESALRSERGTEP